MLRCARVGQAVGRLLAALALVQAFASPLVAADLPREIAARQLVDEAAMLKIANKVAESLAKLDLVLKQYSDTAAAAPAEYSRPDVLRRLNRGDDAVAAAEAVAAKYPKSPAAAEARLCIARTLLDAGLTRDGLRELVMAASGETAVDSQAVREARALLGPLCEAYLKDHSDALDAADYLGMDRRDANMKAFVLATIAAYRGRDGLVDQARPLLERLERECPDQTAEIAWARLRVAAACLDSPGCSEGDARWAANTLRDICLPGSIVFEDSSLWLARCHMRNHNPAAAAAVLQGAVNQSKCSPRILYALASVLLSQNRREEADPTLKRLVKDEPVSSYTELARFVLDHPEFRDSSSAIDRMIRKANDKYDPKWRVLAYCPTDTWLDLPGVLAVQAVSLVREGFHEPAMLVLDKAETRRGLTSVDALRARGELCLCSLESAPDMGYVLHKQPDVLFCVFNLGPCKSDAEYRDAMLQLISRTYAAILEAGPKRLAAPDRSSYLLIVAPLFWELGMFRDALHVWTAAKERGRVSEETAAVVGYNEALCYKKLGNTAAARREMERVIQASPNTQWASRARGQLYLWGALDAAGEAREDAH